MVVSDLGRLALNEHAVVRISMHGRNALSSAIRVRVVASAY
jgi:hypothetical protein